MSESGSIPKILHRVVPAQTNDEVERFWASFEVLHPDWELRTWRDPISHELVESYSALPLCSSGAQLADIVRLEVLWLFGGIYVDADCEALRSLESVLRFGCFIGSEDGQFLTNAVIGATPRHPAIRAYLDAIIAEDRLGLAVRPNESTGPHMATHILGGRPDVTVLPPEFFYPYSQYEARPEDPWAVATPFTLVVHHWHGSWLPATTTAPSRELSAKRWGRQAMEAGARRALRTTRRALDRVRPTNPPTAPRPGSTYVGDNRVLVGGPDDLRFRVVADDLSITPELVANGVYDEPFLAFLRAVMRPGDHAVDVGANIGLFTVAMASRVGRFGRVYSFEPDPELYALIGENLAMNWLAERADVRQMAVGDFDGQLTLHRDLRFRGNSVTTDGHGSDTGGQKPMVVPSARLDTLLPTYLPVRLVKIDVEGAEWRVLAGIKGLIERKCIEFVDLEVIRGNAGPDWPLLVREMRFLVDMGATVSLLGPAGQCVPIAIDEVVARAGQFSHVIFRFPRN